MDSIAEQDILAIEILSMITITVTGLTLDFTAVGSQETRAIKPTGGTNPMGKSTATPTDDGVQIENISDSGRSVPIFGLFGIIALAVTTAIFF